MTADLSHLLSIFILLQKMWSTKVWPLTDRWFMDRLAKASLQSCAGISFKSQVLYLVVYVTRYLGLTAPRLLADKAPG